MNNEEWRDIAGFEGVYQVSNKGRIKSLERIIIQGCSAKRLIKEHILKEFENGNGYKLVSLGRYNRSKKVHRLVAEAFIDNPNDYPIVNHKNEDRSDNRAENLEWCSQQYNINYGNRSKKYSDTIKNSLRFKEAYKKRRKPILMIDIFTNEVIKKYDSLESVKSDSYNAGLICMVCKGQRKTAYGYKWGYAHKQNNDN